MGLKLAARRAGKVVEVAEIGRGDPSTAATVAAIQAVIDWSLFENARSAKALRSLARGQLQAGSRSVYDYARLLWEWAKGSVIFEADPDGVEILTPPVDLLDAIHAAGSVRGDCKKLSTLLACLVAAGGFTPALCTCGRTDAKIGGEYQHIFACVRLDPSGPLSRENLYPIDPQADRRTGKRTPAGAWPTGIRRLKFWGLVVTAPTA